MTSLLIFLFLLLSFALFIAYGAYRVKRGEIMPTTTKYNQDLVKWSEEQSHFLLTKQFSRLDIEHLANEVLEVGKSEVRELESHIVFLLANLLKWQYQPTYHGRSWILTINEQRRKIRRSLRKMPSLKSKMSDPEGDFWEDIWESARYFVAQETGLDFDTFPVELPWVLEDILTDDWLPDSSH